MECDKNMGLINQKAPAELSDNWVEVVKKSRVKPSPFQVVECDSSTFRTWTSYLTPFYKKKNPFPTRPIRQIRIEKELPRWVSHRSHYNGAWETTIIRDARTRAFNEMPLNPGEFFLPDQCSIDDMAISKEKYKDLQDLSKFCSHRAAEYFKNLKHT